MTNPTDNIERRAREIYDQAVKDAGLFDTNLVGDIALEDLYENERVSLAAIIAALRTADARESVETADEPAGVAESRFGERTTTFRVLLDEPVMHGTPVYLRPQPVDPTIGNWINADDVKALVRRLDVAINGEAGAAKQASLCDIVLQVEKMKRTADEAVGEIDWTDDGAFAEFYPDRDLPLGAKLYTRPQPTTPITVTDEDVVQRVVATIREADEIFKSGDVGQHYVRDCLLPVLSKHGLCLEALTKRKAGGE